MDQDLKSQLISNGMPNAFVELLTVLETGNAATVATLESVNVALRENTLQLKMIFDAFPEDGLKEHAEYHKAHRERAKFWKEMRVDLAKKGIVFASGSLAVFAVTALWVAFKAKLVE